MLFSKKSYWKLYFSVRFNNIIEFKFYLFKLFTISSVLFFPSISINLSKIKSVTYRSVYLEFFGKNFSVINVLLNMFVEIIYLTLFERVFLSLLDKRMVKILSHIFLQNSISSLDSPLFDISKTISFSPILFIYLSVSSLL